MCGDVFTASCDIEPAESSQIAWLLLAMGAIVHMVQRCDWASDSDDERLRLLVITVTLSLIHI